MCKVMDCPASYICRINTLPSRSFSLEEANAIKYVLPLLEVILRARLLTEKKIDTYNEAQLDILKKVLLSLDNPRSPFMLPY